jgi:hypothetical protein
MKLPNRISGAQLGEKRVTICIAAACNHSREGGSKIILCSDWLVSGDLGSSNTKHKQDWLPYNWRCMIAGDPLEANILVEGMRRKFTTAGKVDETNIGLLVKSALYERRSEMRDSLAEARFGMTHAEILQFGKERLPPEHFGRYLDEVASLRLETEFIVTGFSNGDDFIVQTDRNCEVRFPTDFACIGEGEYLARASLLSREISPTTDFGVALYEVYEAKKASERVVSIGKPTLVAVIDDDGKYHSMKTEGKEHLERQYQQYGPKTTPILLSVPSGLFW